VRGKGRDGSGSPGANPERLAEPSHQHFPRTERREGFPLVPRNRHRASPPSRSVTSSLQPAGLFIHPLRRSSPPMVTRVRALPGFGATSPSRPGRTSGRASASITWTAGRSRIRGDLHLSNPNLLQQPQSLFHTSFQLRIASFGHGAGVHPDLDVWWNPHVLSDPIVPWFEDGVAG
jgi:hypothetical protein